MAIEQKIITSITAYPDQPHRTQQILNERQDELRSSIEKKEQEEKSFEDKEKAKREAEETKETN